MLPTRRDEVSRRFLTAVRKPPDARCMNHALPLHRPYRHDAALFQIGLKPLAPLGLIDLGTDHIPFMARKRARLAGRPASFYGSTPGSLTAQEELLRLVLSDLRRNHPCEYRVDEGRVIDLVDGAIHDLTKEGREPLEVAADLIEEDLILLQESGADVNVIAASNAYSTTRRIISCVGRSMRFAHEYVPGLNERLAPRIDRVLAHVQAEVPVVRYNWVVTPLAERLAPETAEGSFAGASAEAAAVLAEDFTRVPELLWIRSERQAFARLTETDTVAFFLHTYSDPLSFLADDLESLTAIHKLLGEYSEERLRYSAMAAIKDPLIKWIESRVG